MKQKTNWIGGIFATLWLLIILVPVYVMVVAAFESQKAYAAKGPLSLPSMFSLENFQYTIDSGFMRYMLNSLIITAMVIAIVLIVVPPLAFAIVRSHSRWVKTAFRVMLFGLAIPAQVVVIPVMYIIQQMGLYDTLIGVALPSAAFSIPMCTIILSTSMRDIGNELYEAMALDGATSIRTYLSLVLPLSKGGIATIVIYTGLGAWNNYLLPLTLTRSDSNKMATLGLGIFQQQHSLNVPGLMSAIIISMLPILLLYIFARKQLVRGVMGMGGK